MAPELPSAELRALAEAATPGPWRDEIAKAVPEDYDVTCFHVVSASFHADVVGPCSSPTCGPLLAADAAYIAAANPTAILTLLDRLATAEVARDEALRVVEAARAYFKTAGCHVPWCSKCNKTGDNLRAALAALDAGAAPARDIEPSAAFTANVTVAAVTRPVPGAADYSGDAGAATKEPCEHDSATGVDQTPLEDEAKVWRCDSCGYLYRNVTEDGITRREPAGAPREATDAE